jgi:hypothetical protein
MAVKHKTKEISLKTIKVDVGIVPVVQWLNRLNSVFTQHSCEGFTPKQKCQFDKDGYAPSSDPYVVFFCFNGSQLEFILDMTHDYGDVKISRWENFLRYNLTFFDKDRLKQFIKQRIS